MELAGSVPSSGAPAGQIYSFINDSPGDGFVATGIASTGATGGNLGPLGGQEVSQTVTMPVAPGFAIGQNSLVTAYGVNLAPNTASAAGPPYPTTLGGIRLHLGASLAQLLYVSPAQINYVSPPGTYLESIVYANPAIGIERVGSPFVAKGLVLPAALEEPTFFTVDSSGVAAATAVRVSANGVQTPVPVFDCSTSPCSAVPIDLSGDPVYLSLYGTGMDYTSPGGLPATFTCGGGTVVYWGPQGVVPGLDQVNLLLSRASSGAEKIFCQMALSEILVVYSVDVFTNSVTIAIK